VEGSASLPGSRSGWLWPVAPRVNNSCRAGLVWRGRDWRPGRL